MTTVPPAPRPPPPGVWSHLARLGRIPAGPPVLDACSSAAIFDGWAEIEQYRPTVTRTTTGVNPVTHTVAALVSRPRAWLLSAGWRRHGLLSAAEIPLGRR